ncbi:uncharacterized protein PHALS_12080 [Plasmopara halstedii]|uniref:Uncharacterized protein n=1 Tax=Plasmopara halstedii TaxID=4781 RepID=A0A0P1AKV2_PLAHL|nr:uncharacterized protein PHALS_12080 [Plasmopara halstedii]CEG41751.1 hypothetical protein PHALS_12080 [Plasmopara halstedii]|eukprot:XP_024578120.1 hypothetical protein PHALS_12080 [Plasmopara halstedii]
MSSLHVYSPLWKKSPQLCDACWSHSDSDDNTIASASLGLDSTIAKWEGKINTQKKSRKESSSITHTQVHMVSIHCMIG